ncbi:MAG: TolC family protein [Rikenellaceae bacterium]|nr:TolC family protein [Rikenellaceae bacterium]
MKTTLRISLAALLLLAAADGYGQKTWTLRDCIDYARENNIQVQAARITREGTDIDLLTAKARKLPSLNFSSTQSYAHQKSENPGGGFDSRGRYSGSYSLNAEFTLYNGGKLNQSVRQQEILGDVREAEVETAANDIEVAVIQGYLQVLYDRESLTQAQQTVESSAAQLTQSQALLEAGSISVSDHAQIEAQYSSDLYNLTAAENALSLARLQLKQLLELGIDDRMEIYYPELDSSQIMATLPPLHEVYRTSLGVMPQIAGSLKSIEASLVGEKIARADRIPTLSVSAAAGTGNFSQTGYNFFNQLNNQFNQSAGLRISIPIFNNRQTRSAIEKAQLSTHSARLDYTRVEKDLLQTVETLYQDALSARSSYVAASDKLRAASLSYDLVSRQFDVGMKTPVDLLTEKNNFLSARQQQLQTKYKAILSIQLLNFYPNIPVEL